MRLWKMISCLLAAALMMSCAFAFAEDFTFSLNSSGDGYIVSDYTGSDADVKIPDWYQDKPVTEIGKGAFEGNTALKSVAMPSTITRVGAAAFKNCSQLSKVSSYTASTEPPVAEKVPGDVNGDGVVDANDALRVLQYSAGWNVSLDTANADVNGNGSVDVNDAVLILRYGAGEDVTLQ